MKTLDEILNRAINNRDINLYVSFPAEHPAREIPGIEWRSENRADFATCRIAGSLKNADLIGLVIYVDGVFYVEVRRYGMPIFVVNSVREAMDVISNMWLMRG